MKRLTLLTLLISLVAVPLIAEVVFDEFRVDDSSVHPLLYWRVASETGITTYEIQRSIDSGITFTKIGTQQPDGDGTLYVFRDNDALKRSETRYYYRIAARDSHLIASYSDVEEALMAENPVVRTWGSLKAMFR